MRANHLVTIAFVYAESAQRFHARNAFASGGVYEDPATGAAAAALAGPRSWRHTLALGASPVLSMNRWISCTRV
jgi:predicted PhzF superfamily epimerase YddE/YHI9